MLHGHFGMAEGRGSRGGYQTADTVQHLVPGKCTVSGICVMSLLLSLLVLVSLIDMIGCCSLLVSLCVLML